MSSSWRGRRDAYVEKICPPLNDYRSAERGGLREGWNAGREDAIKELCDWLRSDEAEAVEDKELVETESFACRYQWALELSERFLK